MSYLLDTDTCIYWLKGQESVRAAMLSQAWSTLAISVITVAELYHGAYHSTQTARNLARAEQFVTHIRVLPLDFRALSTFGNLKSQLRKAGTPLADFDLLIASTALAGDRTLVSNNLRHYERIPDLKLQNWLS
jgi:tRNA(fMet)-specific endonuclease VapC